MAFSQLFTDVITKLESLQVANPQSKPPLNANNYQKTASNINNLFKFVGIWNDQIDNEIREKGFIIKCPAVFIEFIPEDPKMLLGGYTQYVDAKMYFHIFSDQLNTPNKTSGLGRNTGDFMDVNTEIFDLRDSLMSSFIGFHTHNSSAMMTRYNQLDYRHNTITKHLLGFSCPFVDDKGSVDDDKAAAYIVLGNQVSVGVLEATRKEIWVSGNSYVQGVNVVWFLGQIGLAVEGYYLCLTSNNSANFTPAQWQQLPLWSANTVYSVGNYIYLGYFCYQCLNANSDTVFTESNWNIITRI